MRDSRKKEMFKVDDEYLNGYARLCGTNATLVYLCLCRHADRNQESFPSVEMMAEKTNISRQSVMRGIKKLIQWNIISKERERRKDATWLNNRYTLLDKSVWKSKPSTTELHGRAKYQMGPSQVPNGGVSQVPQGDTKVTHRKVAHIEGHTYSESGFDAFWLEYPRKVGKPIALRAWLKLKPSVELQTTVVDGLKKWKECGEWKREGGRFIPHPTTFLNQRRWEDEPLQIKNAGVVKI